MNSKGLPLRGWSSVVNKRFLAGNKNNQLVAQETGAVSHDHVHLGQGRNEMKGG